MKKKEADLSGTFLYRHCARSWWPALDAQAEVRHYKPGEVLFSENEAVTHIYFMVNGLVKVQKSWSSEKELIIRFAKDNDILGHRGIATHSAIYPVTAIALQKTVVCAINLNLFKDTLLSNPGFIYHFMMFFADELMLSEERMRDLVQMQARERVAKAIGILAEKIGAAGTDNLFSFTISRQDLASFTGTTYETVYKTLIEFSSNGWISTKGKTLTVLQPGALQAAWNIMARF